MTTLTKTHDSATCTAANGQPCEFCAAAIAYETRQVIERVKSECYDRCDKNDRQESKEVAMRNLREAIENDRTVASVTTIRAAIADVLDEGDSDNFDQWLFFKTEEDWQTERRTKFMDSVVQRITQLQQPPHNFDERLRK